MYRPIFRSIAARKLNLSNYKKMMVMPILATNQANNQSDDSKSNKMKEDNSKSNNKNETEEINNNNHTNITDKISDAIVNTADKVNNATVNAANIVMETTEQVANKISNTDKVNAISDKENTNADTTNANVTTNNSSEEVKKIEISFLEKGDIIRIKKTYKNEKESYSIKGPTFADILIIYGVYWLFFK